MSVATEQSESYGQRLDPNTAQMLQVECEFTWGLYLREWDSYLDARHKESMATFKQMYMRSAFLGKHQETGATPTHTI